MSKFRFTFLLVIAVFTATILTACNIIALPPQPIRNDSTGKQAAPPLLLISIDGVRHDYLEKTELPNFARLARGGLRADSLQHVFPTKTFVTHYSLVTGLYADGTGVVANSMWDPDRRSRFSLGN
ncbi:MAG: putative AlkP superfamily pyrophosphatase or phosphodiesterase [Alphaproteobacteria bacterium]|jgi:predicted AlkP superfamily pyrophosphatase or phosphodiesterase